MLFSKQGPKRFHFNIIITTEGTMMCSYESYDYGKLERNRQCIKVFFLLKASRLKAVSAGMCVYECVCVGGGVRACVHGCGLVCVGMWILDTG